MHRAPATRPTARRAAAVLVALVLVLAVSACEASVSIGGGIDLGALEELIVSTGDEQAPEGAPWSADCEGAPTDVEEGDVFECTATAADGTAFPVTVTAEDDEGNVSIEF